MSVRVGLVGLTLAVAACQGTPALTVSCNTALTAGTLVAEGASLVLEVAPGDTNVVTWPDGVRVASIDGMLSLVGFFGQVIARAGDYIEIGGGVGTDGMFHGCGDIKVISPGPDMSDDSAMVSPAT